MPLPKNVSYEEYTDVQFLVKGHARLSRHGRITRVPYGRRGRDEVRICNAIGEPSLKFGFLPIRKRCCFHVVDNAIPDCFSDLEPFLDTEAVDPEVVQ